MSDLEARARAVGEIATNLVVSAGAGTGKTSLVVERVLHAVGSGTASISAIAAITFTEKAAGELRDRIAAGLDALRARARGEDPGTAERERASTPASRALERLQAAGVQPSIVAERAAASIDLLDAASISTIHAFCADLLRAHPLEAGVAPGFVLERPIDVRRLMAAPWAEFVGEELGPAGARRELWERALATVSLADVAQIARVVAGGAVPDDLLAGPFAEVDLRAALGPTAAAWAEEIRSRTASTAGLTDAPREWLTAAARALAALAAEGAGAAQRAFRESPRLAKGTPDVRTKKVSTADADALEGLIERAAPLLRAIDRLDEAGAAAVLEAVAPFSRRARESRRRDGILDFEALLVRARDLLRDRLPVREELKRRFRMILLDEFQDTDPLQYEIVLLAAEVEGGAARDPYATRLAPGRLFIVGDAKQSIYRFRGADYAAYRRAVAHVLAEGGVELALTTNFRALDAVLAPINALFAPPAWTASEFLPPYVPIDAARKEASSGAAVEVWTASPPGDTSAAARRRLEGQAIAAEIAASAGPGRPLRYADVLVLLRGFGEVGFYLRGLREAGVPFVVAGGRTFLERAEIVQALGVLRAVADAGDEVALLAYLRSPAGGVSDRELAVHGPERGWRVDAPVDAAACPALAAAFARLAGLRAAVEAMPVDAAIAHVVRETGLLPLSGLGFEAAQRVANLEKLLLAARTFARDGRSTLGETLDAIEESLAVDEEGDSPLADETIDAVRVMTIHRAKGLEARLVIVADTAAGRGPRHSSKWQARATVVGAGKFLRLGGPRLRNGAAIATSLDDGDHESAEDLRLLYVALTRARDRLIVFAGGRSTTPWVEALAAWGYDPKSPPGDGAPLDGGSVAHRMVRDVRVVARPAPVVAAGAPDAVARYEAAVAAVAALAAPPFSPPSRQDDGPFPARERDDRALAPDRAREVGLLVHRRLAGLPVATTDDDAAREAEALVARFAATKAGKRHRALDVVGREVPVLLDEGDARWDGVVDLIYRDGDGTLVAADYKTDADAGGAIERHGAQLGVYVRALRRAYPGASVRGELWMVRTGDVLEVL